MMKSVDRNRSAARAGFTLPVVLVIASALLILAIGLLLLVGIERKTARSYLDRERAELTARAGLQDVISVLRTETANDDFLVVQSALKAPIETGKTPAPNLFLARGKSVSGGLSFRYLPLFSTAAAPPDNTRLAAPAVETLVPTTGGASIDVATLPYLDKARLSWVQVKDKKGQLIGRYAFWVEDLQSRVDAGTAGNTDDTGGAHKRFGWTAGDVSTYARFPAPGLNPLPADPDAATGRDKAPGLNQVALFTLDPASTAKDNSTLDKTIIDSRRALISPDSTLAVAGVRPPLTRDATGRLVDTKSRAVEENLTASVQPYDEQPLVPFAHGIAPAAVGKPKLNLNALIAKNPDTAVNEMASWIETALPTFKDRKGGLREDYLKTLAASAIGYAAPGNKPIVRMGSYRGLGASPMISEIVMDINYLGNQQIGGIRRMNYEFILFAEMLNHTNLPINGQAALSYEVGLELPAIGAAPAGTRFDDPGLLRDPSQSVHDLVPQNGRFWSRPQTINLRPGEYRFVRFATVRYTINVGSGSIGSNFNLSEDLGAAGLSMRWNDEEVERIPAITRESTGLSFLTGMRKYFGKAAIPGHSYGPYGEFINNMGDPRIAHYIPFAGGAVSPTNGIPLGENSFPNNISPNRRNIRFQTIYSSDSATKPKTYGRVIPSEWPDGGHDVEVPGWNNGWSMARQGDTSPATNGTGPAFDPTTIANTSVPQPGESLTYLSDRGRYFSATELGRIYDPIMWVPTFDPASGLDSRILSNNGVPIQSAGIMPAAGSQWPSVQIGNAPSIYMGGGNTLRIGRPEHPQFDIPSLHVPQLMPGNHAARLLDLFHAGKSRSNDKTLREGPVARIEGHINLNTASRDSLRAMAAGLLVMDPKLSRRSSDSFDGRMAPAIQPLTTLSAPSNSKEADLLADAIILGRPYTSPSELASLNAADGKPVFGNPDRYPDKNKVQWTDSAAEEVFGRVYEAATVRSRNFRVWVVGQAIAPTAATNTSPEILAEVRKSFTVFADPGVRKNDGSIDATKFKVTILNENDF
jgi:hypothetical protein